MQIEQQSGIYKVTPPEGQVFNMALVAHEIGYRIREGDSVILNCLESEIPHLRGKLFYCLEDKDVKQQMTSAILNSPETSSLKEVHKAPLFEPAYGNNRGVITDGAVIDEVFNEKFNKFFKIGNTL